MPYYSGDYYQGDGNYAAGGIFGSIGKALGKVGKAVVKVVGGAAAATPIGRAVTAALPSTMSTPIITGLGPPIVPKPGFTGFAERLIPGGQSGYMIGRRRRMNVTNVRALRRAGRRVKGFLKLASRLGALPVNRGKGKQLFKRKKR